MMIGDLQVFDQVEFSRRSRQLDLLARGDFSPIKSEIAKAYPNTNLQVKALPFVQRYVSELSGLYARPVTRRFMPHSLPDATWQTLQKVYDDSEFDKAMDDAEQALRHQNTIWKLPMPDGIGKLKWLQILPWQIDRVEVLDPLRADEPAAWSKVWINVPVSVVNNLVVYGLMVLTPTEAWRYVGGKEQGIFNLKNPADKSHPFGTIPLIASHRVKADPGHYAAPVNEAVLNLAIALCLQQADNELIIRTCAFPQKVMTNGDTGQLTETMQLGPDKVYVLVRSGDAQAPSPELKVVQGAVPVAELVSFAEFQIRLCCSLLGLDPANFIKVNTSVTASARLFAAQDRKAERDKILPVLQKLETEMLRWTVKVLQLGQPFPVPANLDVEVTYNTPEQSYDPLNDALAMQAGVKLGTVSPVDYVANRDGKGRAQALLSVQRNLSEARDLGILDNLLPTAKDAVAAEISPGGTDNLPPVDGGTAPAAATPSMGKKGTCASCGKPCKACACGDMGATP